MLCQVKGKVIGLKVTEKGANIVEVLVAGTFQHEVIQVIARNLNGAQPGASVEFEADVTLFERPGWRPKLSVRAESL